MTAPDSDESQSRRMPAAGSIEESSPDASNGKKSAPSRQQLSFLGLVLACGAGAGLMALRSGPQPAGAAIAPVPAAGGEIGEFIAADAVAARRMEQTLRDAGRIADETRFSPAATQVPVTELKTNPFRMRAASAQPIDVPDDSTESRSNENERQAILREVQALKLQSILRGDSHRACLINSTLYQEGQEVAGFVIEEIALTTVVVRRDVYRFELKMTK